MTSGDTSRLLALPCVDAKQAWKEVDADPGAVKARRRGWALRGADVKITIPFRRKRKRKRKRKR